MTEEEEIELRAQLVRLRQEHRDLDIAIESLQVSPASDILQSSASRSESWSCATASPSSRIS